MAKDPAFLFYPGDFLTGTMFFTDEQVGKFIRLLCAQHQHGHLSEKQVLHICKTYDSDIMEKMQQDAQGLFFNAKLDEEASKRKSYTESRKNNRLGKKEPSIPSYDTTYDKHMSNHMENENENENRNIIEKENKVKMPFETQNFLNHWQLWIDYKKTHHKFSYKTPQSEQAAILNLVKICNGNESIACSVIQQSMANGWKGFFEIKNNEHAKSRVNHITDQQLNEAIIKRHQAGQ